MFGLNAYIDKIYDIKWYVKNHDIGDLEKLLYIDFEAVDDYYLIKNIRYTFVDILLGLEEVDFTFKKEGEDYKLIILKI